MTNDTNYDYKKNKFYAYFFKTCENDRFFELAWNLIKDGWPLEWEKNEEMFMFNKYIADNFVIEDWPELKDKLQKHFVALVQKERLQNTVPAAKTTTKKADKI